MLHKLCYTFHCCSIFRSNKISIIFKFFKILIV
nr:MAG TPA: hypothetical protein [Caudoviricetes sp.]